MAYENLLIEKGADRVALVTFNRPNQMNTFNSAMAAELDQALKELDADRAVNVLLLTGAGRAFCAGIDVREFAGKSQAEYRLWVEAMERPLLTISQMAKPVIAAVNGVAAANGGGLVAAADLAIASERARIGYTAVKVGLFCHGPAVPLMRVLGRKQALELLLYGDLITAQRALEMGLLNRVVPADELMEQARDWAAKLAALSPVAVQRGKKAIYAAQDKGYQASFDLMNDAFAELCATDDAAEGVAAFLEKRQPRWSGS